MKHSRIGALVVGMGMAASVASAQGIPGFRPLAQTARVSFFTRSATPAGGHDRADMKRTDSFVERMERELGQPLTTPISYYRYERPEDIAAQTGVYATGLTRVGDSVVHATQGYNPHELVHAVAGHLGNPGVFFHEGLAVALGDEGRWGGRDVDALARTRAASFSTRSLLAVFDRSDADLAYPLAGSFVKHLIATDGMPRLLAFFRACGPKSGGTDAVFLSTYGRSLDQAVAAWQQGLRA
jgi:hypothetical protein